MKTENQIKGRRSRIKKQLKDNRSKQSALMPNIPQWLKEIEMKLMSELNALNYVLK